MTQSEFTNLWTNTWADVLLIKSIPNIVSRKSAYRYFHWLREEMDAGTRWDDIVRQLLTATGSTFETPATGFYAAERNRLKMAENVAQAFLGIRTQCAQCHNHPFDRWTMDDYYGFAAFFAKVVSKKTEDVRETVVFSGGGQTKHPVSGQTMLPKYLGGDVVEKPPADPRPLLAEWLTAADNPYFAGNVANRLWAMFFGRGIVDPVDDVRISNPPVNGPLYTALGKQLVEYEFDIRRLAADILNSHAYQRTTYHECDRGAGGEFWPRQLSSHSGLRVAGLHGSGYRSPLYTPGGAGRNQGSAAAQPGPRKLLFENLRSVVAVVGLRL